MTDATLRVLNVARIALSEAEGYLDDRAVRLQVRDAKILIADHLVEHYRTSPGETADSVAQSSNTDLTVGCVRPAIKIPAHESLIVHTPPAGDRIQALDANRTTPAGSDASFHSVRASAATNTPAEAPLTSSGGDMVVPLSVLITGITLALGVCLVGGL